MQPHPSAQLLSKVQNSLKELMTIRILPTTTEWKSLQSFSHLNQP
jgi:hypothetical protein